MAQAADKAFPQSERLFQLMQERFTLMQAMALYKFQHQLPIYVPEVEKKILDKVKQQAIEVKLPVKETQMSIQLLMRTSVKLQQQWHQKWHQEGIPTDSVAPDPDKLLRPEINRLTQEIIFQMAKAKQELSLPLAEKILAEQIDKIIDNPFVSGESKQALLQSLIKVAKTPYA